MANKKVTAEGQRPAALTPAFAVIENNDNNNKDINAKDNANIDYNINAVIEINNNDKSDIEDNANDTIKSNNNVNVPVLKRVKKGDSFDRITTYIHKDYNSKLDALAGGQKGVKMDLINEALKAYLKRFK